MIGKIQINTYQHPLDVQHPEWATCDRMGCTAAATHGYDTPLFTVLVCQDHLPEGMDSEALDKRWWERVPEELQ